MSDNPMVTLNRVIAAAMVHGPTNGLELLDAVKADARLADRHRLPTGSGTKGSSWQIRGFCLEVGYMEVINHFWMGRAWRGRRNDVGDVFSFGLELDLCLAEAQSLGVGFTIPPVPIAPSCAKIPEESEVELVLQL